MQERGEVSMVGIGDRSIGLGALGIFIAPELILPSNIPERRQMWLASMVAYSSLNFPYSEYDLASFEAILTNGRLYFRLGLRG